MDWPLGSPGLTAIDLCKVFRYFPRKTTVVRMVTTDKEPHLSTHTTSDDWEAWLQAEIPSIEKDSGLVLILAHRATAPGLSPAQTESDLSGSTRTDTSLSGISEKTYSFASSLKQLMSPGRTSSAENLERSTTRLIDDCQRHGRRSLRQLPFEQKIFEKISRNFFVHGSICRVISRADVPVFSRAEFTVQDESSKRIYPAITYNCRSANTWKDDLALTVTHFPQKRLTFGILFGCTALIEKQVLKRLASAREHVFHPLLLPGIFAEIERERMIEVVESTIDQIEALIYDLNSGEASRGDRDGDSDTGQNDDARYTRRTVWLNTTFLRSRLQIWRNQLRKMMEHNEELLETDFGPDTTCQRPRDKSLFMGSSRIVSDALASEKAVVAQGMVHPKNAPLHKTCQTKDFPAAFMEEDRELKDGPSEARVSKDDMSKVTEEKVREPNDNDSDASLADELRGCTHYSHNIHDTVALQKTGLLVKNRLKLLVEEFDEKIEDCTRQVEGMNIATQWAQGDTNVDIATAAGRDSNQMRSISLVTMLFLPGTFFATIFSMSFFDWGSADGPMVSSWVWIYIVMTAVSTLCALLFWWHCLIHRRGQSRRRKAKGSSALYGTDNMV